MKRETALHVVKPEPEAEPAPTPATSKLWRDKQWKYSRSENTDIRKRFERIRREQAAAKKKGKK